MSVLFLTILIGLLLCWLIWVGTWPQRVAMVAILLIVGVGGYIWWNANPIPEEVIVDDDREQTVPRNQMIPVSLPAANAEEGYVAAESCRECHREQYESWHKTYHRTMTQAASTVSVVPSFDDVVLESRGRTYRLFRRHGEFWVDTIDPAAEVRFFLSPQEISPANLPRVERKIVMTTGSHWHQTYWMQNANGTLIQFPWVYHIDTDKWVYRIDSFLRPPTNEVTFNIWNLHCIGCHSTGGEPRFDQQQKTMHSKGEMGISCEACHGPGEAHLAVVRNQPKGADPGDIDLNIFNPSQSMAVDSSQACGQCHSMSKIVDGDTWYQHGNRYRPGNEEFESVRRVIIAGADQEIKSEKFGDHVKTGFWPDGSVRTGGREYNGMVMSECYLNGTGERQVGCVSCHSMHNYESTSALMKPFGHENEMCTQCHQEPVYNDDLAKHTHHLANSEGSRCVNCHMPKTSYALFRSVRSHYIDSPKVAIENERSKPNACSLCHLDQSRRWTANYLAEWYSQDYEPQDLDAIGPSQGAIASGIEWALKGDAAQRACAASHLNRNNSLESDGEHWQPHVLAEMLTDEYAAIRYIAERSLRTYPEYENSSFDFDADAKTQQSIRQGVLNVWQQNWRGERASSLLIKAKGIRDDEMIESLLDQKDRTPISLVE